MVNNDIFRGHGVEIQLKNDEDFLKIKETLTRIGVASRKENKLFQSCHILHKQGHYAIIHFKEMFALDGKETDFSPDDKARLNRIACLLEDWGLLRIINRSAIEENQASMNQIKIINYKEKNEWQLVQKYSIGSQN